jgi:hypothetical protein
MRERRLGPQDTSLSLRARSAARQSADEVIEFPPDYIGPDN